VPSEICIRQYHIGEYEAKTTVSVYVNIRFMFVSHQVRSLDHATLGFKLNGIMKKIN